MKTLVLLLLAAPLAAQTLPGAPRPHIDRAEWALLATDAATRTLDCYSTHRMLAQGNHEDFLPAAIANHAPAMAAYSAGAVALNWYAARKMAHHHRKLAHVLTIIDIGQVAPLAVHNLFLGNNKPPTRTVIGDRGR